MTKNTRSSPEIRQRAVRMVLESQNEYGSQWAALSSIAPKSSCTPETLRIWLRQYQRNAGDADGGLNTSERQRLKELEREVRELRRSNDILRQASAYFAKAEFDRLWKMFAGRIVGWRVSSSMETTFVLDVLEQALWARRPTGTVHLSVSVFIIMLAGGCGCFPGRFYCAMPSCRRYISGLSEKCGYPYSQRPDSAEAISISTVRGAGSCLSVRIYLGRMAFGRKRIPSLGK